MIRRLNGALFRFTSAGQGTDPMRNNLGLHVGDDPVLVHLRRQRLAEEMGVPLLWMDQVHGAEVALVNAGSLGALPAVTYPGQIGPLPMTDGVVIDARDWPADAPQVPGAAVMIADCMPVLLASAQGDVVAAVHAGRPGLLAGILTRTVAIFRELGIDEVDALIGPCACGSCYEVPAPMCEEAALTHPASRAQTRKGTPAIDLVAGAVEELETLGVGVRAEGICTIETEELHSHRRDPRSGRQVGVIAPRLN